VHIDRERALRAFDTYVSAYDAGNERIALKIEHTLRVAGLCERIARSEGFAPGDVDLAWLCGLLHDIGRFEQVRRWGTFSDAASTSHAALGVDALFGELEGDVGAQALRAADPGAGAGGGAGVIGWFVRDKTAAETVRTATAVHSDYRVPAGMDGRTRAFCDVVRDADKVDILRAACTCDREAIFGVGGEALRLSGISGPVREAFYGHRTVLRSERSQPADLPVSFACFVYELVHDEAARAAAEQGHALELLEMEFDRPETRAEIAAMQEHLGAWLAGRLAR